MNEKKLILVGGGGHCKSCIDVIEHENSYEIHGILDSRDISTTVLGYPILGDDEMIKLYASEGYSFLITVGQIKFSVPRKKLFDLLVSYNANVVSIISPYANVSKHAIIGKGTIVMHRASVNAGAIVKDNCIINTGSNIEHDVIVGANCHISTHAVVNGNCVIGDSCFIGSNTTVSSQIVIANDVIVGAGSTVVRPIAEAGTFVGSPARKVSN